MHIFIAIFMTFNQFPDIFYLKIWNKNLSEDKFTFSWKFLKSVTTLFGRGLPSLGGDHPFLGGEFCLDGVNLFGFEMVVPTRLSIDKSIVKYLHLKMYHYKQKTRIKKKSWKHIFFHFGHILVKIRANSMILLFFFYPNNLILKNV